MKNTLILITAASIGFPALLFAQEADVDPFAKNASKLQPAADAQAPPARNLNICYEAFSLPLPEAAALMRSMPMDAHMYKTILAMVDEKKAKQETLSIIRTRSGQKATTEAVVETIYPTEWEPPELPNVVGVQLTPQSNHQDKTPAPAPVPDLNKLNNAPSISELPAIKTAATATAFETRNTGVTLEVEPNLNPNGTIDIRIAPEHVTLLGRTDWGQGAATLQMPEFRAQRLSTGTSVNPNMPHFLGTISEPPAAERAKDHVPTVWFAFITVNPVN